MAAAKNDTTPYWSKSATFPRFAKLVDDAKADVVVVVGGGITGLRATSCSKVVVVPRRTRAEAPLSEAK